MDQNSETTHPDGEESSERDQMDQDSEVPVALIEQNLVLFDFLYEQLQLLRSFTSNFTSREQMVEYLQRVLLRPQGENARASNRNFERDIDNFTSRVYGLFDIDWSQYTQELIEDVAQDLRSLNIVLHRIGHGLRSTRNPVILDRNLFRQHLSLRRAIRRMIGATQEEIDRLRRFAATSLEEGETCMICLENFALQDDLVQLPCCHSFHYECAKSWLQRKPTCPVDRSDIFMNHSI